MRKFPCSRWFPLTGCTDVATYVIGDVQGCADPMFDLLDQCRFDPGQDRLWLAGDLVNRGPGNLRVLRVARELNAVVVLGNHDIHLLARAAGARKPNRKDTLDDILCAPDRDELLDWLRHRPLLHVEGNWVLSHAGVPPNWTVAEAQARAEELERFIASDPDAASFACLFGNEPSRWYDDLRGLERLRVITNYFTRMRFCGPNGELDFDAKEGRDKAPAGKRPWFDYPRPAADHEYRFLFGHWAALEGETGAPHVEALDTGCVWGNCLTAFRLEDGRRFKTSCTARGAAVGC